jgi:hypothetical protein
LPLNYQRLSNSIICIHSSFIAGNAYFKSAIKRVFHYCAIISLGYGLFIVLTLFLLFDVFSSLFKSLCSVLLQLTCRYCHNELKTFCFLFCTGEKSGHEVLQVGFVDDDLAVVHILQDVVEGDMTVELSCSFTVCFFEGLILLLIYWSR